jgi:PKD repeat protein
MKHNRAFLAVVAAVLVVLSSIIGLAPSSAQAASLPAGRLVSDNPAGFTPHVLDGEVDAIVQVGDLIILGGTFTQVANDSDRTLAIPRASLVAFNATTGVISTAFAPNPNGPVYTIAAAADGTSIYVGGSFTTIAGATVKNLARIRVADGSLVTSFNGGSPTGEVRDLKLDGTRLWVAGAFTNIRGRSQPGLATLNAAGGGFNSFFTGAVAGVHKTGSVRYVRKIDLSPDGRRLVAVGNFDTLNAVKNHQLFMLDLTGATAVQATFQTSFYEAACSSSFDTYLRDVDFAPDSSFFVVSTTGAYGGSTGPCDSIARFDTAQTGTALQPAWIDYTGGDTTYAVEVTPSVVYVGGHQRWHNNAFAADRAGAGAVSRPGVAALNPLNGLPYSWNPTRDRGVGVFDFLSTSQGLWMGSDTDRVGESEYHAKIALFPAAGAAIPAVATPALPNDVYAAGRVGSAGDPSVLYRVNGGGPALLATKGIDWGADSASPYSTTHSSTSYTTAVGSVDATVPAGTPTTIFSTEAWDPAGGTDLIWSFPVPVGTPLQVRLYFANRSTSTSQVGQRRFNVAIDGVSFLSNFDIVAAAGHNVGTMRSKNITSDGTVNISFGRLTSNPLVNAVEIVRTDLPASTTDALTHRTFTGTTAGAQLAIAGSGVDWNTVRGGFMLNGQLYSTQTDGSFVRRSFDGTGFGTAEVVAGQDALAVLTDWRTEAATATGMFYDSGRIYFTLSGANTLYYRYFNPESGIVGAKRYDASAAVDGITFSAVRGMFLAGGKLYWATTDEKLRRIDWVDGAASGRPVAGTAAVVSGPDTDGQNWSARALFLFQGSDGEGAGQPPLALFTLACTGLTCQVDGSGSSVANATLTSYSWNWGDGSTTSGVTSSHTYLTEGERTVSLTVTSSKGGTAEANQVVSVVAPNLPPVASFTAACELGECSFDASGSSDDSAIASWAWQFGDGTPDGSGVTVPHTYATVGSYEVTLTLTDDEGAQTVKTQTVKVVGTPTAAFSVDCLSLVCSFDASGSTAPGSTITSYAWTFPGGATDTGATTSRTFAGSGTYPVTLTVTTQEGLTATLTTDVEVTRINKLPTAEFSFSCNRLACSFDPSGSADPDGTVAGYAWDFGDGQNGTGSPASHTFATGGTYQVALTVTDNDGATAVRTRAVEVSAVGVSFVAGASTGGNRTSQTVQLPSTVQAGDQLLAFFTGNATVAVTAPAGWTQLRATDGSSFVGRAWARTATASDAGASVTVTTASQIKGSLVVGVYRSTTGRVDLDSSGVETASSTTSITAPAVALGTGSLVVSHLGAKANATLTPALPSALVQRQSVTGSGSGGIYALLADSGQYLAGGSFGPNVVGLGATATRSLIHTVVLKAHVVSQPTAAFTFDCVSRTCSFDASGSTAAGSSISGYGWAFGDTTTGTGSTPSHDYTADGTFQVTLTVTNVEGMTAQVTRSVAVARVNQAPTAAFTVTCVQRVCDVDATAADDPDGSIATYDWTFGDGDTGQGRTTSHTFGADGSYQVGLTVTDNDGATASLTKGVSVLNERVTFVASAANNGSRTSHVVTIPAGVQAGDQLVLFLTTNSDVAITGPSGWSEVRTTDGGTGFEGRLWTRTAVASDAGANVAATTTATVKSDVTVAAYRSNTGAASVAATDLTTASSVTSLATPQVALGSGSLVVDYIGVKAASTVTATLPGDLTQRRSTAGSGSGAIYAWLADSGDYLSGGSFGGSTVTLSGTAGRALVYSVVVRAA